MNTTMINTNVLNFFGWVPESFIHYRLNQMNYLQNHRKRKQNE